MHRDLVEILAEPGTGAPLELEIDEAKGDRVVTGTLISTATSRRFPIVRSIPRFVEGETYAETFGRQWNAFRRTQLDSSNGGHFSRDRFFDETEWTPDALRGRWVLDAGCGAGRFAEVAAQTGCRLVALDYSSAVEAASETLAEYPDANVVQGSVLEPPFRRQVFDYVYCIGVIQHTPAPQVAVDQLIQVLKEDGGFAMTIYARRPWTKLNAKYLLRPMTKRLPQDTLLSGIRTVMPVVYPVADRLFRVPGVGKLAQFAIPVAVYQDRQSLSPEDRYEESVLDTLDMLSPAHDHPMTPSEVEEVLQRKQVQTFRFKTRRPVNVIGVR